MTGERLSALDKVPASSPRRPTDPVIGLTARECVSPTTSHHPRRRGRLRGTAAHPRPPPLALAASLRTAVGVGSGCGRGLGGGRGCCQQGGAGPSAPCAARVPACAASAPSRMAHAIAASMECTQTFAHGVARGGGVAGCGSGGRVSGRRRGSRGCVAYALSVRTWTIAHRTSHIAHVHGRVGARVAARGVTKAAAGRHIGRYSLLTARYPLPTTHHSLLPTSLLPRTLTASTYSPQADAARLTR